MRLNNGAPAVAQQVARIEDRAREGELANSEALDKLVSLATQTYGLLNRQAA